MLSILRIKQRRSISRAAVIQMAERLNYFPERDASSLLNAQNAQHDFLLYVFISRPGTKWPENYS